VLESVVPSAIVRVEPVAGAVSVTLLMLVAVAAPSEGDVAERLVTVVPLGRARIPVELVLIVAVPLTDPFSTRLPATPNDPRVKAPVEREALAAVADVA
jgi:hypothetical protein